MRLRVRVGVHEEGKENMSSHAHELQQAHAPPRDVNVRTQSSKTRQALYCIVIRLRQISVRVQPRCS